MLGLLKFICSLGNCLSGSVVSYAGTKRGQIVAIAKNNAKNKIKIRLNRPDRTKNFIFMGATL